MAIACLRLCHVASRGVSVLAELVHLGIKQCKVTSCLSLWILWLREVAVVLLRSLDDDEKDSSQPVSCKFKSSLKLQCQPPDSSASALGKNMTLAKNFFK